ncbi:MAG: NAD(P)-binding protein [Alphaproteobacteria bacterium]|nr:NAD(P)-binding protein [Alphaproteobacteria bacterium]
MTDKQKHKSEIVIVGGGAAGLTLAALLGRKRLRVDVIEKNPPKRFEDTTVSGKTVALMLGSLNVLKGSGLKEFCEEYGTDMEVMTLIDDSLQNDKKYKSDFDSFDINQPYFSKNIPDSLLRARLYEDLKGMRNVTLHAPNTLKKFVVHHDGHAEIILDDETFITTNLIVGADGRHSKVRELAGIEYEEKPYDQRALTFIVNHSRSHNNTSTEFHREGGPLALVPMSGNQSSVVWIEKTEKAEELIKLPKDAFERTFQKATLDILGGITLETNPQSWPICSINAKKLIAQRVALIAEAVHVMSPITAQGLNLSLRDVASLAEIIVDAKTLGLDIGSHTVLKKYEQRRQFDIKTRTMAIHTMNTIVKQQAKPVKELRRSALKILDRIKPLKTFGMKVALAPPFDKGRLLRGENL